MQRCPQCGREFERNFGEPLSSVNCPECEERLAQFQRAGIPARGQAPAASSYLITIVLIALNALVFAAMVARGASFFSPTPQQAIAFGADFGPLTLNGQWWRLVTSMFVHFGIIHIALNMWCLWNLGRAAEYLMGRTAYVLAYFVSGIFASIASVYWHPLSAGAGASGAIFGMAGVLVTYVYLKKTPAHIQINRKMLSSLGTFIAYNLAFGALPGISNAAHIGGLVMGLAVGAVLPASSASDDSRRSRLSLVAFFSAIVLVGSAVAAKKLTRGVTDLGEVESLFHQNKMDEGLVRLQRLTAQRPEFAPAQELLSKVYLAQHNIPEAIVALQKARDLEPGNKTYAKELSVLFKLIGMGSDTSAVYSVVAKEHPKDAYAHFQLGQLLFTREQYDDAASEFRQEIALDPSMNNTSWSDTPYYLALAQLQAGHNADAAATYKAILAEHPDDKRARAGLGLAAGQTH